MQKENRGKILDEMRRQEPVSTHDHDDFFDAIDESAKLTSTLTDIRQTYTKRQRTVVTSEKEFSQNGTEDSGIEHFLDQSPSLVRADTDRMKLLESAHEDENLFKDMGKRDALVKKKSLEPDISEAVETKSYDSEDSLDEVELEVAAPRADQGEKGNQEPPLRKQATKQDVNSFISDLVHGNLKLQESDSFIKVKYDIFKLINKNEHLFIKYAEKKLVENKTYVMERA